MKETSLKGRRLCDYCDKRAVVKYQDRRTKYGCRNHEMKAKKDAK